MKNFTKKHIGYGFFIIVMMVMLIPAVNAFAQESAKTATDSGINSGDIFEFIIAAGYMLGVFVLFPWVVYTNLKEGLSPVNAEDFNASDLIPGLSEEERNQRAMKILEEIDGKLTPITYEGENLITITKGSQARYMRKGINYIRKLQPTDPAIIERVNEFVEVYKDRAKRAFTGSKWIIGCAVAMGALMTYTAGISTFTFIHVVGIIFYIMSSRTPVYLLEKRIKFFGRFGGVFIGSIFSGLFIGANAKHYKIYSDGSKERDYDSELTGGMVAILIIFIVAMILGFLVAALGVLNFVINYMGNALLPIKPEAWYEKTFVNAE